MILSLPSSQQSMKLKSRRIIEHLRFNIVKQLSSFNVKSKMWASFISFVKIQTLKAEIEKVTNVYGYGRQPNARVIKLSVFLSMCKTRMLNSGTVVYNFNSVQYTCIKSDT